MNNVHVSSRITVINHTRKKIFLMISLINHLKHEHKYTTHQN